MGFTYDTAITVDTDLFKIALEQELTNILRESGKTDFSDLHKEAVNAIIRSLKANGVTYASVDNTRDFKHEAVYWVLATLYLGEEPDPLGRKPKFETYYAMWQKQVATRVIEYADGTKESPANKSLPILANHDSGAFIPTADNGGDNIGQGEIDDYDIHTFNRPS